MATKLKHQGAPTGEATTAPAASGGGGGVLTLSRCTAEGCSKKAELITFCNEHYSWFKFGLLTKEGHRPTDFDKKYQAFMKRKAA